MSNYTYRETYHRDDSDRDRNTGGWKSWLGLDDNKNKEEYHVSRSYRDERDRDHQGGWRSWLGMDNDSDKNKNDYHYSRTTTYRNDDRDRDNTYNNRGGYTTSTYVRDSDRDQGYGRGYGSNTGYSTGYNSGNTGSGYNASYNVDRSYDRGYTGNSSDNRGGYGYQTSSEYNRGTGGYGYGDRDNYNRESTYVRSYNSDRDNTSSTWRDRNPSSYERTTYTNTNDSRGAGYGGYNNRDGYGGSYSYTTRSNY